jgi:altronate hydrolase
MDVVPDGEVRFGFPNISDNAEIVEMMASGAHMTLFVTGRGSVVGSALAPVIKIAANPEMYERLSADMDVNAGRIILGEASVDQVGQEIYDLVLDVAAGEKSCSEAMGHAEFILTYKSFEPIGPACLPA